MTEKRDFVWNKPLIVLTNEFCASGGDIFPLLVKGNQRGKIFGRKTIGAGGSVREVSSSFQLVNTGGILKLTRSLIAFSTESGEYSDEDMLENKGVMPDREYALSETDVLDGSMKDYLENLLEYAFQDIADREVKDEEEKQEDTCESTKD
jgi:C-terminal processing protease CtpA/Prc